MIGDNPAPRPIAIHSLWNAPNLLSAARLPLAAGVCACVALALWPPAIALFTIALVTDWADGWWARRYGPLTKIGRALDPLTDKVLLGGTLVYLQAVPGSGVEPWVTAVVISRELLVTGVRGMVEAEGVSFGADRFGKLKTALQFLAILAILARESARPESVPALELACPVLIWLMVAATVWSGVQYLVRAAKLLSPRG